MLLDFLTAFLISAIFVDILWCRLEISYWLVFNLSIETIYYFLNFRYCVFVSTSFISFLQCIELLHVTISHLYSNFLIIFVTVILNHWLPIPISGSLESLIIFLLLVNDHMVLSLCMLITFLYNYEYVYIESCKGSDYRCHVIHQKDTREWNRGIITLIQSEMEPGQNCIWFRSRFNPSLLCLYFCGIPSRAFDRGPGKHFPSHL